jgi:hypothetical protein
MFKSLTYVSAVTVVGASLLVAQDPPARVGRISSVSGTVSFQPAGVTDWAPASVNRTLTIGDQLFVDQGGKAEVHVPGAAFRMGDSTAFQFLNLDDRNVQVRLSEGTLDVRVRNLYGGIEIDGPNASFTPTRAGEYRIDTNPDSGQTYITVRDGQGQVTGSAGSFTVSVGQQAAIAGTDQSAQYNIYGAPGYDSFDNWVKSRSERDDRYATSRYVSAQMVGYEDLGDAGTWRSTPDYGDVWVPNGVSSGWAPYQSGQWSWVEPWGWTWVDDEPWGFAPFHYGRWAYVNGSWGWCPGPASAAPVFAPALVAWVGFGGGGVSVDVGSDVGWFPLGPRDVYIPSFGASAAYVTRMNVSNSTVINTVNVTNVYNNYVRTGSVPVASYMNRSVPNAVMAVPQNALTSAQPVKHAAIKLQPNQIAAVKNVEAAPRVAPQMSSVLGHQAGTNVPHPAAAVLSHGMVARTTPPAASPSFQQRQALLAKTPGRPVPIAQLHQMAKSAPATEVRPPVRVMSQARTVTPAVAKGPAPRTASGAPVAPPAPAARNAPPAQPKGTPQPPARSFEPPAAQRAAEHPAVNQPVPPARQPARETPPVQAQQHPAAPPARVAPSAQTPQHAAQHPSANQPVPPARQPARETPPVQTPQRAAQRPPAGEPAPPARQLGRETPPVQAQQHPATRQPAPPVQAQQHPPASAAKPAPPAHGDADRGTPPARTHAEPPPAHTAPAPRAAQPAHPTPPPHNAPPTPAERKTSEHKPPEK